MVRLEVRIPISPKPHYFQRVRLIAHSILSLGPIYRDTIFRVFVGGDQQPENLNERLPWSASCGIEWCWVNRADFLRWRGTAHPYIATMMERFRPPFYGRHVLMLDADVVAVRPFDELIAIAEARPSVLGVMAHATPFRPFHSQYWNTLFQRFGCPAPEFSFEHSGWGIMDNDPRSRQGPPYFNTGVLLVPSEILCRLYKPYMAAIETVRSVFDNYFVEQIGLTLAVCKESIPYHILPLRYNYPNDPGFDDAWSLELANVCLLHFLRDAVVRRDTDFTSLESMASLIERGDLRGSNEVLRSRVADLLPAMMADSGR